MSELFAALGGDFVEPRVIIEAALPLELSGEAVRGRICVFTDEEGREWALRPDLTLPVAVDEIERRRVGASGERVVRYSAPVFRLPALPGEPVEFLQTGFERFGGASDAESDASVFAAIAAACAASGATGGLVTLGDLGIFPAFVDALGLAPETASGLKRAFRQEGGVRAYLNAKRDGAASDLSERMRGMSASEVAAFVDDIFALTGVRPVGDRSAEEIAERLHQRANAQAAGTIDAQVKALLESILAIDDEAGAALRQLKALAETQGLSSVAPALARLEERTARMSELMPELMREARFSTRYGRRFTYYDGFVFEIAASLADSAAGRPYAAGGRYDQLLNDLSGGEISACAVGGIVVPHRLAAASGDQS